MLDKEQLLRYSRRHLVSEALRIADSMTTFPYVQLRKYAEEIISICEKVDQIDDELNKIAPDDPE